MRARIVISGVALLSSGIWTAPVFAQAASARIAGVRAVELYAHVGAVRAGGDEGTIGTGPGYGGAVLIPVGPLALELDATTVAVESETRFGEGGLSYRTRRTLVIPSLVYRFGTRRLYGFAGGGIGAELERSTSRQTGIRPTGQPWREIEPGLFELEQSDMSRKASLKTGFVTLLTESVALRGDVMVAGWHVAGRIGVGYRFD